MIILRRCDAATLPRTGLRGSQIGRLECKSGPGLSPRAKLWPRLSRSLPCGSLSPVGGLERREAWSAARRPAKRGKKMAMGRKSHDGGGQEGEKEVHRPRRRTNGQPLPRKHRQGAEKAVHFSSGPLISSRMKMSSTPGPDASLGRRSWSSGRKR